MSDGGQPEIGLGLSQTLNNDDEITRAAIEKTNETQEQHHRWPLYNPKDYLETANLEISRRSSTMSLRMGRSTSGHDSVGELLGVLQQYTANSEGDRKFSPLK